MYTKCITSTRWNSMNEDRSAMITVDCFLKVYSMLNNFVEFLEFHGFKYCRARYKRIPLQGALKIVNKIDTFGVRENLSKQPNERPGLFADYFHVTQCTNTLEDLVNKIETATKCLTSSMKMENFSMQVESILAMLIRLPCAFTSKKVQILAVLLKEAAENMACHKQAFKEPLAHIRTQTLLNHISNFIREWGEQVQEEVQPRLKLCRFCDSIINDEARRYARKYCCDDAKYLDQLLMKWLSLHVSEDTSKFQFKVPDIDIESKIDRSYCTNIPQKADFTVVHDTDKLESKSITISKNEIATIESYYENRISFRTGDPKSSAETHDIPDTSRRMIGRTVVRSYIETDQRDRYADEDLSAASDDHSFRRGKTEASTDGARGIGAARNTDTIAERIREERDDNSYRRKLNGVEDKDRQDRRSVQRDMGEETDRSRAVAVEGRKGRRRGRDTEAPVAEENDGAQVSAGGSPYQHRRGAERETRLPDNRVKKIGRLDRAEGEDVIAITKEPAKRHEAEWKEDDRRDGKNDEQPVISRDKKEVKRDKDRERETTPLGKMRVDSKKTIETFDDTEMTRYGVNEVKKSAEDDGKLRCTSTSGRYSADLTKKRIVSPANPIEYQLSNAHFINLGWTLLPATKRMRKIVQYEARPAKLNWFKRYRHRGTKYYDDRVTPFLRFHSDGSGELFYPNGILAVRVYRPEKRKYDMYTVFTPGGKDALGIGRESQILAIFDSMGNGVIFDENGTARLSYNQIGGIFTDNPAGLPLVWTWNANPKESILEAVYTEKSTDRLQMDVFPMANKPTTSSGNVKTPVSLSSSRNKEKKVEVQKPVIEKRQEEVESKSNLNIDRPEKDIFHIKIICMKLNEFLGLRIIDRRNIALKFSAGNKSIRIELGTILNFNKELASCIVEASDWKSDMLRCRFQEELPKKLKSYNSLYNLAREYRKVQKFAKERETMINKYRSFTKIVCRR